MTDSTGKILLVDDDRQLLRSLKRNLKGNFNVAVAEGGWEALDILRSEGPFAVICADMRMPDINGIDFLTEAKKLSPESIPLMLTGDLEQKTVVRAVNQGNVFRYLNKPCSVEDLTTSLNEALEEFEISCTVGKSSGQILDGSLKALANLLNQVEPRSSRYWKHLSSIIHELCTRLEYPNPGELETAAKLCDLFFIYLSPEQAGAIRTGQRMGWRDQKAVGEALLRAADLLTPIPPLRSLAQIVLYHRKNYDGSGLPLDDVAEEKIPEGARILKVAFALAEFEQQKTARKFAYTRLIRRLGNYDPAILDAILPE